MIYAFWCRVPSRGNVGDALTPWMIRRITGEYPRFARPDAAVTKYFVSGSIVEYAGANCVVWGAGIMSCSDPVSPHAMFLAVRGPLTREAALVSGAGCPPVYGDPALLLPRLYHPPAPARRGMGLVPHFSDLPRILGQPFDRQPIRLIDVGLPVESFVDQVRACEFVASSSLHGIIISHAYGIPAVWVKFRDLPSGDDSKFRDYFLSVGDRCPEPLRLGPSEVDPNHLATHAWLPNHGLDLDRLWECCPFR